MLLSVYLLACQTLSSSDVTECAAACGIYLECSSGSILVGMWQMACCSHPHLPLLVELKNIPTARPHSRCHRNIQTVAKAENDEDDQASDFPFCICPDNLQVCLSASAKGPDILWQTMNPAAMLHACAAHLTNASIFSCLKALQTCSATLHALCHQDRGDSHYLCTR